MYINRQHTLLNQIVSCRFYGEKAVRAEWPFQEVAVEFEASSTRGVHACDEERRCGFTPKHVDNLLRDASRRIPESGSDF